MFENRLTKIFGPGGEKVTNTWTFRVEKSASGEPASAGGCRLNHQSETTSYIRTRRDRERERERERVGLMGNAG
jgi:hypothetical protein